ncbi:MAG: hypothetical protein ACK5LL_05745 [Suipraeoptans sp.]
MRGKNEPISPHTPYKESSDEMNRLIGVTKYEEQAMRYCSENAMWNIPEANPKFWERKAKQQDKGAR